MRSKREEKSKIRPTPKSANIIFKGGDRERKTKEKKRSRETDRQARSKRVPDNRDGKIT